MPHAETRAGTRALPDSAAQAVRPPLDQALTPMRAALATVLLLVAGDVASGVNLLTEDNDAMLRLVGVRDLIDGQGWFDAVQHRMGLAGGFEMHWSRLVDAPIAALILAAETAGFGRDAGEALAGIAWPALCAFLALWASMRIARALGGPTAMIAAAVIAFATYGILGRFAVGALDHHGPQIALALAALSMFTAPPTARGGAAAGACAALMAAIGIETNLHVALFGAAAAIALLADPAGWRRFTAGFGLGFAAVIAFAFASTVPAAFAARPACDAFSVAHALPGAFGGVALAAAAWLTPAAASPARRALALAAAAGIVIAAALPFSLGCIRDPLADLDPLLKTMWLSKVTEAMPLTDFAARDMMAAMGFGMPALAGFLFAVSAIGRKPGGTAFILPAAMVGLSLLLTLYQFRSVVLAAYVAVPLLGVMVARAAGVTPSPARAALAVGALLVSVGHGWALLGDGIDRRFNTAQAIEERAIAETRACTGEAFMAALASVPPAFLFNVSNIGAPILMHTRHRVLAGPYHRNVEGLGLSIRAFTSDAAAAAPLVQGSGATHLVWCPGAADAMNFADAGGLAADLTAGRVPDWLTPQIKGADGEFTLYRIER